LHEINSRYDCLQMSEREMIELTPPHRPAFQQRGYVTIVASTSQSAAMGWWRTLAMGFRGNINRSSCCVKAGKAKVNLLHIEQVLAPAFL
jgi:hypothetical protein